MITKELIQQLREMEKASTQGEWSFEDPCDSECFNGCYSGGCLGHARGVYEIFGPEMGDDDEKNLYKNKSDAYLICALRNNAKALLDEIERLQAENERLKKEIDFAYKPL